MPEEFEKYEEEWEVYMSNQKAPYSLNEKEHAILEQAILDGQRGMVVFSKFSLAVPFIVSMYRKSKRLRPEYQIAAPEVEEYNPTPEQIEATRKKVAEIREQLKVKFSKKNGE